LQESLIKFNKFLQENESKRNRALKRAAEERKQRELKEMEIQKLESQLKSKLREESILKEEVEKNLKYQDYLDNVVQNMSKFFPEIADILNRYTTLRNANSYLIEKHFMDEGANDNIQREYISFKKFKENQILNHSNAIAGMQLTLEQGKTRTNRVQGEIDKVNMDASEKSLELGQIISSVSNILERCEESFRIRHNKPHVERSTDKMNGMPLMEQFLRTMSKLDEIEMFMIDYRDITMEFTNSHDIAASTPNAANNNLNTASTTSLNNNNNTTINTNMINGNTASGSGVAGNSTSRTLPRGHTTNSLNAGDAGSKSNSNPTRGDSRSGQD